MRAGRYLGLRALPTMEGKIWLPNSVFNVFLTDDPDQTAWRGLFMGIASNIVSAWGLAIAAACLSTPVMAAATIDASDNGWYDSTGSHSPTNTNTYTGALGAELRSFYVFNVSGFAPITSASITFFGGNGIFVSDTGSETANLYDYSGLITSLLAGEGGVNAFNDLGSGTNLGSYTNTAENGSAMPEFTILLGSAFISQFNNAANSPDGRIAIGAALQNLTPGGSSEAFWSFSGDLPAARLNFEQSVSAVPEPSTWAFMIFGFGFVGISMRRARRRQKVGVSFA